MLIFREIKNVLGNCAYGLICRTLVKLPAESGPVEAVQSEIRMMNETLVTLATELKHTNEHLARHEQKIDSMEAQPRMRLQQIVTAIIAALAGGLISAVIGMILT